MKFDFVIGNPPYQEESSGEKKALHSIYNYFMEESYKIADKVELITPARFLFRNGDTSEKWNEKMLQDEHLKVLSYEVNSEKIFENRSIKGGVAVTFRNSTKKIGPIGTFTPFSELNSILKKVNSRSKTPIVTIMYNQSKFNLDRLYDDYEELVDSISNKGREKRMTSGCLEYPCFHTEKINEDDVKILGLIESRREYKYINKKYIENKDTNLYSYKVILPANNGSGAIGEVISTPLIGQPLIGHTQTFISIGKFVSELEADAALKYVKSKFARTMLGILKVTQNGKKDKWRYVPLQDFTPSSDIDWSQSISEIDRQLYKKYGLDKDEIAFIESHVKEME